MYLSDIQPLLRLLPQSQLPLFLFQFNLGLQGFAKVLQGGFGLVVLLKLLVDVGTGVFVPCKQN